MGGSDGDAQPEVPLDDSVDSVLVLSGDDFEGSIQAGVSFVKFYAPW